MNGYDECRPSEDEILEIVEEIIRSEYKKYEFDMKYTLGRMVASAITKRLKGGVKHE